LSWKDGSKGTVIPVNKRSLTVCKEIDVIRLSRSAEIVGNIQA
jgi:hypothetical protein